jgi:uncharacterized protein (DUF1684 family)
MKLVKRVFSLVILVVAAVSVVQFIQDWKGDIARQEWERSLWHQRHQKDKYMKTSPFSPMAGTKRLTIKADQDGQRFFVVQTNREFSIAPQQEPNAQFVLENPGGRWTWQTIAGDVTCTAGEKPVNPGSPLPGEAVFQAAGCALKAYETKNGLVLLVFDPKRPEIQEFSHLYYFPPDPEFAVPAVLKKFDQMTEVTMMTSQNLEKTFYRYAAVHFEIGGKDLRLTAFKFRLEGDGADSLFIPFADATSGKQTYEVGRFLEITEPKEENFVLDFNRCFNPLCNYSPAYNCPIPPLENTLEVAVDAGEKTYPH